MQAHQGFEASLADRWGEKRTGFCPHPAEAETAQFHAGCVQFCVSIRMGKTTQGGESFSSNSKSGQVFVRTQTLKDAVFLDFSGVCQEF